MTIQDLLGYVDIRGNGAILIGENFTIDGFYRRPIHVITHAHADHLGGLNESVKYVESIIATPATVELILELGYVLNSNSSRQLFRLKTYPLHYFERYMYNGEILELLPVEHIIGAAQILIETKNTVIGYTGDFKLGDETLVIEDPDILIMESTYGDPEYRRPFKDEVEDIFLDIVEYGLREFGRVYIYGYHGKLQEAMKILRERGVMAPFIMPNKIYRITRIAEKYGYVIGEYYNSNTREGREAMRDGYYIFFDHMVKARRRRLNGSTYNIVLSGWEFKQPARMIDDYTWLVALSDHADFDELIEYVERSNPKIIVLDASREGSPKPLARELTRRGFKVYILPGAGELA